MFNSSIQYFMGQYRTDSLEEAWLNFHWHQDLIHKNNGIPA
jgi:hypothetical protein